MSDNDEHMSVFKNPRNIVLVIAAAFGLYMLVSGIVGILGGSDDGDTQSVDSAAAQALAALPSRSPDHRSGYQRSEFGDGWGDLNGDGCNTRNEILARDLTEVTFRSGTADCVVETGVLTDPYTGTVVDFQRGANTSDAVQIDHVVPVADAWGSGAWEWDLLDRVQFYNDPLNLLAVQGQANQEKADMTADKWLPSNKEYACDYVLRQIQVKTKYHLAVTDAEREAMLTTLATCGNQELPAE